MDVLVYLLDRPGDVVPVDELIREIWAGRVVEESAVHQAISKIRRALGDDSQRPVYLESIPRRGYRVVAPRRAAELDTTTRNAGPLRGNSRNRLWMAAAVSLGLIWAIWALISLPDPSDPCCLPDELPIPIVIPPPKLAGVEQRDAALLTDEILRRLAKIAIFEVSPGSSREQGKPTGYRLLPSMQALADAEVEVSLSLSRARDGRLLWTGSSTWASANHRDSRRNLVEQAARAMKALLDPRDLEYLGATRSTNGDALHAFLMGRVELDNRTPASYERALSYFNAAIRLDPQLAMAYLGKAIAYGFLSAHRPVPANAAQELFAEAKALDPDLPGVLVMEAGLERIKGNYDRSDQLVSRVVERYPDYRDVGFADLLAQCGRVSAGLQMTNAILEDDSEAVWPRYMKARFLWVLARNREALAVTDRILATTPGDEQALLERSRILRSMGRTAESVASLPSGFESLRSAYDRGGLDGLRQAQLEMARAIERGDRVESPEQAWRYYVIAYAALGEAERAVEWLAQGLRLNHYEFLWFRQYPYPGMSEVRQHTAFSELMEQAIGATSRCPAAKQ